MIYFITGKIGGGKSLLALTHIMDHLAKGGCVLTNIALDEVEVDAWLARKKGRFLAHGQVIRHDFEQEPEFQKITPFGVTSLNVMIVCDEAQLYYNQVNSTEYSRKLLKLISFLTQSRKCCVDVWFITQHDTTVWAQFRHQALFGYKCRDMRVVSLPFIGQLPSLGLQWVKYDIISGETMERGSTPLSKDLFKLYDTRQMFDEQMRELRKTASVWEPVDNRKGAVKVEKAINNPIRIPWWARLLGLKGIYLLPREGRSGQAGGRGSQVEEGGGPGGGGPGSGQEG